ANPFLLSSSPFPIQGVDEAAAPNCGREIPILEKPRTTGKEDMLSFRQRIARDEVFTLIELLVVLIIIGVLLAIAVPSYLGFKDRAQKAAAKANVRAAIPAVEAFYSDNGTYLGATVTKLKASYDAGISLSTIMSASATGY